MWYLYPTKLSLLGEQLYDIINIKDNTILFIKLAHSNPAHLVSLAGLHSYMEIINSKYLYYSGDSKLKYSDLSIAININEVYPELII